MNREDPVEVAPFRLRLKVGQPIILLRNMNPRRHLCNGTRLIVRGLHNKFIEADILLDKEVPIANRTVMIPRIPLDVPLDSSCPLRFRRLQFPVKPAFAMTINKSQGQTLTGVGLYIPRPVFGHGQLYVALSRCSDRTKLKVLILDGAIPGQRGLYTRNIVYTDVLT